jgi:ankyrin repeat protein
MPTRTLPDDPSLEHLFTALTGAVSPSRLLVEELWTAAKNNRLARVALLVGHGTDVNTPGLRDGRTPYEIALREGHRAVAQYLLRAHGCDVNARHPRGDTLLDAAVGKGLLDFADVLRRYGAQTT